MKLIFFMLLLIPKIAICQFFSTGNDDPHKMEIDKNIFRILMTLSIEPSFDIAVSYEREIFKPFTVLIKAGPSFSREYFKTDAFGNEEYRYSLNAFASGELRYYYNLKRRMKHGRTVRNFSGLYLSLEPFAVSKSLFILNKEGAESNPGYSGTYINIGYQKQVRRTYYNIFFGTRFFGKIYDESVDFTQLIHGGITIGRILY